MSGSKEGEPIFKEGYKVVKNRLGDQAQEFKDLEKVWQKFKHHRIKVINHHYQKNLANAISQQYVDSPGGQGVNESIKAWMTRWKNCIIELCTAEKQAINQYPTILENLQAYPAEIKKLRQ